MDDGGVVFPLGVKLWLLGGTGGRSIYLLGGVWFNNELCSTQLTLLCLEVSLAQR